MPKNDYVICEQPLIKPPTVYERILGDMTFLILCSVISGYNNIQKHVNFFHELISVNSSLHSL